MKTRTNVKAAKIPEGPRDAQRSRGATTLSSLR